MTVMTPPLRAVLGPTNTGKTHLALGRMLAHGSGMIGFPLRLLAREAYDRIVAQRGSGAAALVTGEERIFPPSARYLLCTVEAMPLDIAVAFLAIDEIQLCADPERGHIFTDRLLHARGTAETMVMGAETIRPLLRALVPDMVVETRARLSTLRFVGETKLTRLPPRAAVVGFSANEVYALADVVRQHRGGAAVVLGALSPRTRNAQVALFQSGEVSTLVATDAIGMGLNMDIDHVAFAGLRKFDGRAHRMLSAAEAAQIAGRAGRHTNDGSFGTTADAPTLPPDMASRIEDHQFPTLKTLRWRNNALDFRSLDSLHRTLAAPPPHPLLRKTRPAPDHLALHALSRREAVRQRAKGTAAVKLLWSVCQIPDFRKILPETHANLLAQVYGFLTGPEGRLPQDWLARQVGRAATVSGDIDALSERLAAIRVWTTITQRHDWLDDAAHWQARTRTIEDTLSDALHERLTQRFIDKRSSVLLRRRKGESTSDPLLRRDGTVVLDGAIMGRVEGLSFVPEGKPDLKTRRATVNTVMPLLRPRMAEVLRAMTVADGLVVMPDGSIRHGTVVVGHLCAGESLLQPGVRLAETNLLGEDHQAQVYGLLKATRNKWLTTCLAPLLTVRDAKLRGPAAGLAFRLVEGSGCLDSHATADLTASMTAEDRKTLSQLGIRFGLSKIYVNALLKPRAMEALWLLHGIREETPLPSPRLGPGVLRDVHAVHSDRLHHCGMAVVPHGEAFFAVRVDLLERFAAAVRAAMRQGGTLQPEALATIGLRRDEAPGLLLMLGYEAKPDPTEPSVWRLKSRHDKRHPKTRQTPRKVQPSKAQGDDTKPFSGLRHMLEAAEG